MKKTALFENFAQFAMRVGSQIHLMALRDTFATISPLFILAGVAILMNNVVFPFVAKGAQLVTLQSWGNLITNGTLNIAALLVAAVLGFTLAKYRSFHNLIAAVCLSVAAFVIVMPQTILMPVAEDVAPITGVLSYQLLGTKGIFAAVLVAIISVELFIKLNQVSFLQIHLGEGIPSQVANSFNVMLPSILVLTLFGLLSVLLHEVAQIDLVTLISQVLQEPLRKVSTGPIGYIFLTTIGNLFFSFGIHQSAITGALVDPLLISNMNDNMIAFAAHREIPHIINSSFGTVFGMIGGSGSTISLILAILIFSRLKAYRDIAKISLPPGIFTINEPIIFGIPIVFNLPMIIPFILMPALGIGIGYLATLAGFVEKCVVMIPWTTPPILNAYLATAGDIKAVILQLLIIVLGVFVYLPFMKISERVLRTQAQQKESAESLIVQDVLE